MDKLTKHVRRMSFKQELDTSDTQKSPDKKTSDKKTQEKNKPEPTLTSPRMISQSQKTNSPPKEAILNKSRSEKQSEITAEVKSLQSRKSSSFLPEKKFKGEINLVPTEKLTSDQSQKANSPPQVATFNKSNSEKQSEMFKEMKSHHSSKSTSPSYVKTPNDEIKFSPLEKIFDGLIDDALREIVEEHQIKLHSQSTELKLNKIQPEKNNEISGEMKSFSPRESLSPSILQRSRVEQKTSPLDELLAEDNTFMPESLSASPYRYPAISSTREASPAGSPNSDALTKESISPLSPRMARQVSRSGVLKFDKLPEFYQDLIRKNNGVITSPKDLAELFFLVETECGKIEPNKNLISTPFRGDAKIIEIPEECGVKSLNLLELYWGLLAKVSFDNEEIKKIRSSVIEKYNEYQTIYDVTAKLHEEKNILENELGFTLVKVILDPLIQHLMGGDVVFNKVLNEKIERQPTKLSNLLCEFIYTLDEKIIQWFENHKNTNENDLKNARKNSFTGLILFRGLIKIWTDAITTQDKNALAMNVKNYNVIKIINNFLNNNSYMLFEKIINCPVAEKKEILQQASVDLELLLQHEKIENRKKEIMHSVSAINLPKDKFLSKTSNRNSQPHYGSHRDSLSPRNKIHSLTAREQMEQQEKEQFIDELIQKLDIPESIAEFKQDLKLSLMEIKGREIRIFEKRPYMTCKDSLMIYLGDHREIQTKDIQGFMDTLNEEVNREVNEMELEKRMRSSSKGEDSSPRKSSPLMTPEKEKE